MKPKEETLKDLREWFPRGSTVYSVTRHCAKSNMAGWYSFVGIYVQGVNDKPARQEARPLFPTYSIGEATGRHAVEKNGYQTIRVNGCGYNRPASVVDDLSRALYGKEGELRHESI